MILVIESNNEQVIRLMAELAAAFQARVQIEAPSLKQPLALWTPFTQNLLASPAYSYGGRFPYEPVIIDLPDGRRMEMVFSRERRKLPSPVVLEDFVLRFLPSFSSSQSSTYPIFKPRASQEALTEFMLTLGQ